MARYSIGAMTPSEVFSATVSTAARVTPASSSRAVSRPTIRETAYCDLARSPVFRASKTCILSCRRDLVARIWAHITVSRARPSQGLIPLAKCKSIQGTAVLRLTTMSQTAPPASFSPQGVLGNRARMAFSAIPISFPMSTTGWGIQWGSPISKSRKNPRIRAVSDRMFRFLPAW